MTLPVQNPNLILSLENPSLAKERTKKGLDSLQKETVDNSVILQPFKFWLTNKNYSPSTIRNYLSDTNSYLDFIENSKSTRSTDGLKIANSDPFSPEAVSSYIQIIKKNPAYSRYISSLSKFFQFTLDQNLIKTDPLKAALKDKKPQAGDLLSAYQEYLSKHHFSQTTVKNYLNDIRQFIDWSTNPSVSPATAGSPDPLNQRTQDKLSPAPLLRDQKEGLRKGFSFKNLFKNSQSSNFES